MENTKTKTDLNTGEERQKMEGSDEMLEILRHNGPIKLAKNSDGEEIVPYRQWHVLGSVHATEPWSYWYARCDGGVTPGKVGKSNLVLLLLA